VGTCRRGLPPVCGVPGPHPAPDPSVSPGAPLNARVVVVGSINLDIAVRTERLPSPGETLLATSIQRTSGGKGANQAVAAARAGAARTALIGAVGADGDGDTLLDGLTRDGIDVSGVRRLDDQPTGVALITVDARAENTIVVAAGANSAVALSEADLERLRDADVVLAQLEVPQRVVAAAAAARRRGAVFVLNAAPAADLRPELAAQVDVLVVNEHEAVDLARRPDLDDAVRRLLEDVPAVLVTLGAQGARLLRRRAGDVHVAAPSVVAFDTVAAGDTFCGVYAAGLARGIDERASLERACAAASLTVQRPGAQASIPTAEQVEAQLRAVYDLGPSSR
jgi:ribokinase